MIDSDLSIYHQGREVPYGLRDKVKSFYTNPNANLLAFSSFRVFLASLSRRGGSHGHVLLRSITVTVTVVVTITVTTVVDCDNGDGDQRTTSTS